MRRAYKHLVLFALVSMFVGLGTTASHSESSLAQTADDPPPNIIFILTDDMRYDDLQYMTETSRLAAQGMRFDNAFVSTALCCPSRATIMRGQYAHNTDVWFNPNRYSETGHDGGWVGYNGNGYEDNNVATHLHDAGYTTGFFGKYLNGYDGGSIELPPVPPKWDKWFAFKQQVNYYNYDILNKDDSGTSTIHFGTTASDYSTDVINREVQKFIAASAKLDKPFFAYIAPKAPHGPFNRDAPNAYERLFNGVNDPRLPSFDEQDVSDKPPWIQSLRRLTDNDKADIRQRHENRVESLQAVDNLLKDVVTKLGKAGVLNNTYIVFTSDNGWFHGEHRIRQGKARPYEEAHRVPLVISGPRVKPSLSPDELVLNTDYFPTFLELARVPEAQWPPYLDGRSLVPVLEESATTWRTAVLLEQRGFTEDPEIPVDRNYNGIRTSTNKYVEYEGGFKELYNLKSNAANPDADPYELTNIYDNINNSGGPTEPPLSVLDSRLDALKGCAANTCRTAEDGP